MIKAFRGIKCSRYP